MPLVRKIARFIIWAFVVLALCPACLTIRQDMTKTACRKYLIYPPRHADELVSDRMARNAQRTLKSHLGKCDVLVDYDEGKAFFLLLDISNADTLSDGLNEASRRGRLNRRFGATHVIELVPKSARNGVVLTTSVYALAPFVADAPRQLPTRLELNEKEGEIIKSRHPLRALFNKLNLLPNSVMAGYSYSQIYNRRVENKEVYEYSQKDRSPFPPIISSLWIGNLRHRYAKGLWDVSVDGFGSIIMTYTYSRFVMTPIKEPFFPDKVPDQDRQVYDVSVMAAIPVVGGELAFYTPLGTSFFWASAGWGPTYMNDSWGASNFKMAVAVDLAIGHRIFINDHIFVQLVSNATTFYPDLVKNDYFIYHSQGRAVLGVGTYFPQVKTWARRMM